jgi:hypothetical protein
MNRKLFAYVSPGFMCGFVLMVVIHLALKTDSLFRRPHWFGVALHIYLIVLTAIWLGTVFWFGERFFKAVFKKETLFVIGSATILTIFIALNVRSNIVENAAHVSSRSGFAISFSHDGFYWGFPLPWFYSGTCYPCHDWGAWTVNWFSAIGAAWLVGTLLTRFVQAKHLQ